MVIRLVGKHPYIKILSCELYDPEHISALWSHVSASSENSMGIPVVSSASGKTALNPANFFSFCSITSSYQPECNVNQVRT